MPGIGQISLQYIILSLQKLHKVDTWVTFHKSRLQYMLSIEEEPSGERGGDQIG